MESTQEMKMCSECVSFNTHWTKEPCDTCSNLTDSGTCNWKPIILVPKAAPEVTLLTAQDILGTATDLIGNRGQERDKANGERSMAKAVAIFNAWKDKGLTEEEGWAFMVALKFARMEGGKFKLDDYLDATAYNALMTECAVSTQLK